MTPLGRTQRKILTALSTHDWVNSAQLAAVLDIDRRVIWGAIERLRVRGYEIEGCLNRPASRGYRLLRQRAAA